MYAYNDVPFGSVEACSGSNPFNMTIKHSHCYSLTSNPLTLTSTNVKIRCIAHACYPMMDYARESVECWNEVKEGGSLEKGNKNQ